MKECEVPGCTDTQIIYSGVDATMIYETHITGRFCQNCSKAYIIIRREVDKLFAVAQLEEAQGE